MRPLASNRRSHRTATSNSRDFSLPDLARAGEAAILLTGSRVIRAVSQAVRWQALVGDPCVVDSDIDLNRLPSGLENDIRLAIARTGHRLPWATNCLDRALAAQLMLRRRGTCGTVVIGLRGSNRTTGERWPAHAWLVGETGTITGEGVDAGHRPVSAFRPRSPGLRRGSTR